MPLPPLSLAQIQLLVDSGRISPDSGRQLQTLSRNAPSSAPSPPQPAPAGNLMGAPKVITADPTEINSAVTYPETPGATEIVTGLNPDNQAWLKAQADKLAGAGKAAAGVVGGALTAASAVVNPVGAAGQYLGNAAGQALGERGHAIASNPAVQQAVGDARDLPSPNNVINAGRAIGSANSQAAAPSPDTKGPGESNSVVDRMPASDPVAQAQLMAVGQQQAANSALKTYNEKLDAWKGKVNASFDGYVSQPNADKVELLGKKGELLESQGNDASNQVTMAGAIQNGMAQRDQQIQAQQRSELKSKLDDIGKINDELLNSKIDPHHWFSSLSTVGKIGMAIGAIIGSGLSRKSLLDDVINRDIEIQKAQFHNKAQSLQTKKSLYGEYYNLLQNSEAAATAARASMKEYAHNQLEALAARHAGQQGKANAGIAAQDLKADLGKEQFKLWGMLNPAPAAPGIAGAAKLPNYDRESTVALPDGLSFMAANAKSADELRDAVVTRQDINERINRLIQLNANPKTYLPGTAEYNDYVTNSNAIKLNADKTALGIARSPEGREFLESAVGIPSQYSLSTVVRLKALQGRTDTALENKIQAANGTVIRDGFQINPATGLPERKALPTGQTTGAWRLNPAGSKAMPGAPPVPGMRPTGK